MHPGLARAQRLLEAEDRLLTAAERAREARRFVRAGQCLAAVDRVARLVDEAQREWQDERWSAEMTR